MESKARGRPTEKHVDGGAWRLSKDVGGRSIKGKCAGKKVGRTGIRGGERKFLAAYEDLFLENKTNDRRFKSPSPCGKSKKGRRGRSVVSNDTNITPGRALANNRHRMFPAPAITAKSWAVADFKTGKILWERNARKQLPMASITKIITAMCVFDLCKKYRRGLTTEQTTVSRLAASTIGTSANLKARDELTVLDLLYGMMLPSGNDAACALAEHFGAILLRYDSSRQLSDTDESKSINELFYRMDEANDYDSDTTIASDSSGERDKEDVSSPDSGSQEAQKQCTRTSQRHIDAFVNYMNQKVTNEVRVKDTTLKNPHGMDQNGHASTAYDIVQIASFAMKGRNNRTLQQIVQTLEYTWRSKTKDENMASGKRRNYKWVNTNKLLYRNKNVTGFKTGVTRNAGPCLVSSMKMEKGISILIVTLGSSSRQSRWTEHAKMFKWAGKNLDVKPKLSTRYKDHGAI